MTQLLNGFFDETAIDPSRTVVRCATQDEADILLAHLKDKGVWKQSHIEGLSKEWSRHGSSTCYHMSERSWCYDTWYREAAPGLLIVDFQDCWRMHDVENFSMSFDDLMCGTISSGVSQ